MIQMSINVCQQRKGTEILCHGIRIVVILNVLCKLLCFLPEKTHYLNILVS